jgi:tyrosine-protein phosphatase YwqE
VSFLATDAHSAAFRPNNLLDMLGRLSQDIDYDYLDAMVHRNPDAVLQDKDLYTFYTIK